MTVALTTVWSLLVCALTGGLPLLPTDASFHMCLRPFGASHATSLCVPLVLCACRNPVCHLRLRIIAHEHSRVDALMRVQARGETQG